MLEIIISSILRKEEPSIDDFNNLISEFNTQNIFQKIIDTEEKYKDFGKFRVYGKKSLMGKSTIYEIYEIDYPHINYERKNGFCNMVCGCH